MATTNPYTASDRRYVLAADGVTPVPARDSLHWAEWYETADRRVARTEVAPGVEVSTVFLPHDHGWGGGEPVLWETMVFGGPRNGEVRQYTSHAAAVAGHAAKVADLRADS